VFDRSARARGGTIVMARVVGTSSIHGAFATGAGVVPVLCLGEEGRSEPPSPLEAM
jgi:hypothetical protein